MQFDERARGFSFWGEDPLDMRMDRRQQLTAKEIINTWPGEKLIKIFKDYGEEPRAEKMVGAIMEHRKQGKVIETTKQLVSLVSQGVGRVRKRLHPATLVMQALRIAVNKELENLTNVLPQALNRVRAGGVVGAISFHSLEDRIVKEVFRNVTKRVAVNKYTQTQVQPQFSLLTSKPILPSKEECRCNPRARSAKLRVAKKNAL